MLAEGSTEAAKEMEYVLVDAAGGDSGKTSYPNLEKVLKDKDPLELGKEILTKVNLLGKKGENRMSVSAPVNSKKWPDDGTPMWTGGNTTPKTDIIIGGNFISLKKGSSQLMSGGIEESISTFNVAARNTKGFDKFNVSFKPEDKTYLVAGDEYEDPVFGAFKLIFGGIVEDSMENIELTATGDKADITLKNKNGDETTWTYCFANTTDIGDLRMGSSQYEPFIALEGDLVTNTSIGESDLDGMGGSGNSGIRFMYSMNDESHILLIRDIDTLENKTTFYDLTTDTEYADQDWDGYAEKAAPFTFLSKQFTINFSRSSASKTDYDVIHFTDINDEGTAGEGAVRPDPGAPRRRGAQAVGDRQPAR